MSNSQQKDVGNQPNDEVNQLKKQLDQLQKEREELRKETLQTKEKLEKKFSNALKNDVLAAAFSLSSVILSNATELRILWIERDCEILKKANNKFKWHVSIWTSIAVCVLSGLYIIFDVYTNLSSNYHKKTFDDIKDFGKSEDIEKMKIDKKKHRKQNRCCNSWLQFLLGIIILCNSVTFGTSFLDKKEPTNGS